MEYEVVESKAFPGYWHAEAVDHEHDGEIFVVVFSGPDACRLAHEYAAWKNGVALFS